MSDLREIVRNYVVRQREIYLHDTGVDEWHVNWKGPQGEVIVLAEACNETEAIERQDDFITDKILSALRAEGALVGSKLAAEIGNAFTGFPKCHMFVRYKSDGLGEPHDEGSYYAIKIQDKGPSINFGMTELALELFANEALSRIEADRATNTGKE